MREDRRVRAGSLTPLVGRAEERAAIDRALRALSSRPGSVVAIEGEQGIGKSRLLEHLAACAAREEATVLSARASEFETTRGCCCGHTVRSPPRIWPPAT
jgi:ABC-type transport system involved in cytochrome c biogenesis ATPase subunit